VPRATSAAGHLAWWLWRRWGPRARVAIALSCVPLSAVALAGMWVAAAPLARAMLAGGHQDGAAATARPGAGAAASVVSLTFDDAYEDQWRYAVPLLRSHHMNATMYVITADSDGPYPCCMSWAQLRTLQAQGDDIGSHTISHPYLTKLAPAQVRRQVCGSRRDMVSRGIDDPESFAYPYGSYNRADERVAARCGFTIARQGGGISSGVTTPGPPWSEALPPRDPEAVRTIAVDGRDPIRLPDLERYVTALASHGGGWLPITFHDVCDAYAADYLHCMATFGPIDDKVLGQFLGWLQHAGRPGGAPAGVVVETMRRAANTGNGPDTTAPLTAAWCGPGRCHAVPYRGPVRVSLRAADPHGVGVARTYYTVNGSAPSAASALYQIPLVLTHTATIRFFSVDNAGNIEHERAVTVRVAATAH
jgi:peptidoglycan/xylan/chitin deacetylase (PgdA/CDA1 family)